MLDEAAALDDMENVRAGTGLGGGGGPRDAIKNGFQRPPVSATDLLGRLFPGSHL